MTNRTVLAAQPEENALGGVSANGILSREVQALIANMSGGVISLCVRDGELEPLHYSSAICTMLGYTEAELFAIAAEHGFNCLIDPADLSRVLALEQRLLELHEEQCATFRIQTRSGAPVWVDASASFALEENGREVFYISFTKADNRKKMETSISLQRQVLLNMMDMADLDYCEYDLADDCCYIVEKTCVLYGVPAVVKNFSEAVRRTEVVFEEDKPAFLEMLGQIRAGKSDARCEVRMRLKSDGRFCWMRYRSHAFCEEGKTVRVLGIGVRIEEYKEALRRFDGAMAQTGIRAWVIDIPTQTAHWLNRWKPESSLTLDSGSLADLEKEAIANDMIHPDDLARYEEMFRSLWRGEAMVREQIRQRKPDSNTFIWYEYCATLVETENGCPKTAIGTVRNISAEKSIEQNYLEELDAHNLMGSSLLSFCRYNLTRGTIEELQIEGRTLDPAQLLSSQDLAHTFHEAFASASLSEDDREAFTEEQLLRRYHDGSHTATLSYWARLRQSGRIVWVQTDCRITQCQHTGELIAFFYNRDLTQQRLLNGMLDHLATNAYECSAAIFVQDKMLVPIVELSVSYAPYWDGCDYNTGSACYCAAELPPKDVDTITQAMCLDTIVQKLADVEDYAVQYDVRDKKGMLHRKQTAFHYIDRENGVILLTRTDIALYQQLRYLSEHDSLTGLFNRENFMEKTLEMLAAAPEKKFVFVHVDIARFKLFNSAFGNEEGNRLLQFSAGVLTDTTDTYEVCTYGRMQSDVFGLCCVYNPDLLRENLRRVNEALRSYRTDYMLQFAFGLCIMDDPDLTLEGAITRAAMAAQRCKADINCSYCVYDAMEDEERKREQRIVNCMHTALAEQQFKVYLQPKYDLQTGRPCGSEALVRWLDPERGLISPGVFIPLFERNGFIANLDRYMWEQVCILLKCWKDAGLHVLPVSVNISRISLYNPSLVEILSGLVQKYGLSPELLHLEITESAYMTNQTMMQNTIERLHEAGFVILMDDFGSGYSSLNTLKDFHIDVLKIDMKFLPQNRNVERAEIILASMIHMAKWLGMKVIMEGVETEEQNTFLKGVNCDCIQGFYYARPMPAAEYERAYLHTAPMGSELCTELAAGQKKVLIIEDEPMEMDIIRRILAGRYETECFACAEDALAYLQSHTGDVGLILTDNYLPGMFGTDFMEICQQDAALRGIPKILITANDNKSSHLSAIRHGANDYLVKPIDNEILLAITEKWMRGAVLG